MSCQKNIRFCHRHGWKTSWRLVINIHLFRRSRSIIRPPSDTTESSYRSHLNVTWLMSYSCRYDAFETYKFNVSVDFRNVTLQWCRMLNVTRLCLCVVFAAGSRRVTHCKGMIHPEQHRRKYTVTPSLSLKVTSIVFELLFFFYPPSILSHLTMTCVPLLTPCTPFFFFVSSSSLLLLLLTFTPRPPHLISPLHLVTMQIYLSPLARKTGSSEAAKSAAAVPANSGPAAAPQAKVSSRPPGKKTTPSFTLNLQKTTSSQNAAQEVSSYKSPLKSPSQYFQICYWGERPGGKTLVRRTKPKHNHKKVNHTANKDSEWRDFSWFVQHQHLQHFVYSIITYFKDSLNVFLLF